MLFRSMTWSGVFPPTAFDQPSRSTECLASSGSPCSMRFDATWNGDFDWRRTLRNPKSVSAAAEALKGPLTDSAMLSVGLA